MERYKLDWAGNFINYLIFVYIFLKSIQRGTLDLFDSILASIGLLASILIFIYNNLIKEE